MRRKLDTEVELLVRCVDPSGGGDDARVRSLLAGDPDWEHLLELARVHGVTPLLRQRLSSGFDETMPREVASRLEERARSIALRNVRLADELHDIADAFGDSVRWLPFKGTVLAAFAYGDVGHREYKDIDLLVHPEDVTRAVNLLECCGYELRGDFPRRDDAALLGGPFTKPLTPEYTLDRNGVEVEVRCSVGDTDRPFSPDVETLWSRRTAVDVGGRDVPALSPEDRLLVLAFHGTKHKWHLLKWVCDFGAASADVNWALLFERARNTGSERKLYVGLALIDTLFDIDLPTFVRRRFHGDERAMALAEEIVDDFAGGVPTRPSKRERTRYNARASDSVRDWLPMLRHYRTFKPSVAEYRLLPLPGVLHPLYYILFPFRAIVVLSARFVEKRRANDRKQGRQL